MDCAKIQDWLVAWQDREVTNEQHAVVEQHLSACPGCRKAERRLARATPMSCLRTSPALEQRLWIQLDRALQRARRHPAPLTQMPRTG